MRQTILTFFLLSLIGCSRTVATPQEWADLVTRSMESLRPDSPFTVSGTPNDPEGLQFTFETKGPRSFQIIAVHRAISPRCSPCRSESPQDGFFAFGPSGAYSEVRFCHQNLEVKISDLNRLSSIDTPHKISIHELARKLYGAVKELLIPPPAAR